MNERGSALAEALVVTAIVGVVWAAAAGVLGQVPSQAARWEEASSMRQRLRVTESRIGRLASAAGPIAVDVDERDVRVPSIWPRRLGSVRAGGAAEVSAVSVTFLSRTDGHRGLTLTAPLAAGGGDAAVVAHQGCGSSIACGLREGDVLLAVTSAGVCGLYRVDAVGVGPRLTPLMQQAAGEFEAGSVLIPVRVDVISFDSDEQAVRRYDGYRSDNVMTDGVRAVSIDWGALAASLADGPFIGTGPLAYDIDQLRLHGVRMTIELVEAPASQPLDATRRITLAWGRPAWP